MATHGYMSDGDPPCHSIALNLTLSPARSVGLLSCLDHSALYPSFFFPLPPYLCRRGYLHTFRPTHAFLSLNFGEMQAPRQVIHLTADCLHPLAVKASVISLSSSSAHPLHTAVDSFVCSLRNLFES